MSQSRERNVLGNLMQETDSRMMIVISPLPSRFLNLEHGSPNFRNRRVGQAHFPSPRLGRPLLRSVARLHLQVPRGTRPQLVMGTPRFVAHSHQRFARDERQCTRPKFPSPFAPHIIIR